MAKQSRCQLETESSRDRRRPPRAIKIFNWRIGDDDARRECDILRHLRHVQGDHFQKSLEDAFGEFSPPLPHQDPVWVVTELMRFSLADVLRAGRDPLRPAMVRSFTAQMLQGISALHSAGVVHRDLKPENILIAGGYEDGYVLQLADFGSAYWREERIAPIRELDSTLLYSPPEQLERGLMGEYERGPVGADGWPTTAHPSLDAWAAGCVLVEMLGRVSDHFFWAPPGPDGLAELWDSLTNGNLSYLFTRDKSQFWRAKQRFQDELPFKLRAHYGQAAFDLAGGLLTVHVAQRWSINMALQSEYLAGSILLTSLTWHQHRVMTALSSTCAAVLLDLMPTDKLKDLAERIVEDRDRQAAESKLFAELPRLKDIMELTQYRQSETITKPGCDKQWEYEGERTLQFRQGQLAWLKWSCLYLSKDADPDYAYFHLQVTLSGLNGGKDVEMKLAWETWDEDAARWRDEEDHRYAKEKSTILLTAPTSHRSSEHPLTQ
ncbi:mitogen-activated protein kinase mpkC [Pseudohyphozyma bogoriensis]|nr:mitogen-activated protein kinase mpkC [Pseudohyphozyma bogoriensis]